MLTGLGISLNTSFTATVDACSQIATQQHNQSRETKHTEAKASQISSQPITSLNGARRAYRQARKAREDVNSRYRKAKRLYRKAKAGTASFAKQPEGQLVPAAGTQPYAEGNAVSIERGERGQCQTSSNPPTNDNGDNQLKPAEADTRREIPRTTEYEPESVTHDAADHEWLTMSDKDATIEATTKLPADPMKFVKLRQSARAEWYGKEERAYFKSLLARYHPDEQAKFMADGPAMNATDSWRRPPGTVSRMRERKSNVWHRFCQEMGLLRWMHENPRLKMEQAVSSCLLARQISIT